MNQTLRSQLDRDGFAFTDVLLAAGEVDALLDALGPFLKGGKGRRGGARDLLSRSVAVQEFVRSSQVRAVMRAALSDEAFAVKATLFDKAAETNWYMPWHQDVAIAVNARHEHLPGYGPWSVKAGVVHVQPPVAVLDRMVALRLHLDDCHAENGPLRVAPGSHRQGVTRLPVDLQEASADCPAARGQALLMRPLLWHGSARATRPSHRRVLHIEFADAALPPPLTWHERW